jgi:hypothetical protein
MSDLDHRTREQAFYLWEQAGCPENRVQEFWEIARQVEERPIVGTVQPAETDIDPDPAKFAGF